MSRLSSASSPRVCHLPAGAGAGGARPCAVRCGGDRGLPAGADRADGTVEPLASWMRVWTGPGLPKSCSPASARCWPRRVDFSRPTARRRMPGTAPAHLALEKEDLLELTAAAGPLEAAAALAGAEDLAPTVRHRAAPLRSGSPGRLDRRRPGSSPAWAAGRSSARSTSPPRPPRTAEARSRPARPPADRPPPSPVRRPGAVRPAGRLDRLYGLAGPLAPSRRPVAFARGRPGGAAPASAYAAAGGGGRTPGVNKPRTWACWARIRWCAR